MSFHYRLSVFRVYYKSEKFPIDRFTLDRLISLDSLT